MLSAISTALAGIDAGYQAMTTASARIARDGVTGDPGGSVLALLAARQQVSANVAAARAADDLVGTLIDVLA